MMFLKEINIWSPQLYSLLHLTNFTFLSPNKLRYEGTNNNDHTSDGVSPLVLFMIWSILYYAYKKFLNLVFRRMKYPIIRRNRLIDGLWYCSFSTCSMIFLRHFASETRNCLSWTNDNFRLGFLVHKTFYLHQAAIEAFVHDRWLKGWTIHLFASSVPVPSSQKWPEALVVLLSYKASETALLNICRLLTTVSRRKIIRGVAKFIFCLQFLNWIYMHILVVPSSLLFHIDVNRNSKMQSFLWLWLIFELLNSIRYKEFGCIYSKQNLETSLFPRPSQEVVALLNILKKHKNCNNNDGTDGEANAEKKKTELWQTIICWYLLSEGNSLLYYIGAMTMKKKLKKLRDNRRKVVDEKNRDSIDSGHEINKDS